MKILRFNESNTQYFTCVIVDGYSFDCAGTFKNLKDKDNWLLNKLNGKFIASNYIEYDMEINEYNQHIFTNLADAIRTFEFETGNYIFNVMSEKIDNVNYVCLISNEWNHITSDIFEDFESMEKMLIDIMNNKNWDNAKFKNAESAKKWYNTETDGVVYYGKTKFYENVKLEYGVDFFRAKDEFNL